jgi:hypothetical protein
VKAIQVATVKTAHPVMGLFLQIDSLLRTPAKLALTIEKIVCPKNLSSYEDSFSARLSIFVESPCTAFG